jgi:hypothetical protein
MANGSAEDLLLLQTVAVHNARGIWQVSEAKLSQVEPNTFFRDTN